MSPSKSSGIDVLKAAAALLIINSHLEAYYSRSFLAADGMLGNTTFFFTTGFVLAGSIQRRANESMLRFLWKRLERLYPAVWIAILLLPSEDTAQWTTVDEWLRVLFYPSPYSFVHLVVPLYPLFFLVRRLAPLRRHAAALGCVLLAIGFLFGLLSEIEKAEPGIAWSSLNPLAWRSHFFGAMLLGSWQAGRPASGAMTGVWQAVTRFVGVAMLYVGIRLLALPGVAARLGAWADHAALLSMACCVFVCIEGLRFLDSPAWGGWFGKGVPAAIITFLAMYSWETYLIHLGIARLSWVRALPGPSGIAVIFALTFLLAPVLHAITNPGRLFAARKTA